MSRVGQVRVDYSPDTGALIVCELCPTWSDWTLTRKEARKVAQKHGLLHWYQNAQE